MASYMYTSTTGKNWDDEDDDFGSVVYDAAAKLSASSEINDLALLKQTCATEGNEYNDQTEVELSALRVSTIDYNCDSDLFPTYAQRIAELWYCDSRPAYTELSHDNVHSYPEERTQYTANWKATKLSMGANMKYPMMMRPSALRLSKTWARDSRGDFIEERGILFPPLPSLGLEYASSDDEQDEARTPPNTPSTLQIKQGRAEVEQYDPFTGTIDLPHYIIEASEINFMDGLADSNCVARSLNITDVLGDAASNMEHACISEPCHGTLSKNDELFLGTACKTTCSRTMQSDLNQYDITMSRVLSDSPTRGNAAGVEAHDHIDIFKTAKYPDIVVKSNAFTETKGEIDQAQSMVCETPPHFVFSNEARTTTELVTAVGEADQITTALPEIRPKSMFADYKQSGCSVMSNDTLSQVSAAASQIRAASTSPDLKYNHDTANTSLMLEAVATSWLALSFVPWGRIAVTGAGALVDMVAWVAHH